MVTLENGGTERWQRPALALAIVCLGVSSAPLDSALNIALPSISTAFARGLEEVRWIVIAYVLTYSSLLLIFGRIGDLLGYRLIFQAGLGMGAVGFTCCALAPDLGWLVLGRIVQGVGIALILSCAPALATTLYDESERARIIGIYAAATSVGTALGPVVGGFLVGIFGWSAVFWMRIPVCLAALALTYWIPAGTRRGTLSGFDVAGAALLMTSLVTLLLSLALRTETAGAELRVALLCIAVVSIFAFFRHEARHAAPIIRPRLFLDLNFSLVNLNSVVINYAAFSILLLAPYLLVTILDLDPARAGLVLALSALGAVVGSSIAGRSATRVHPAWMATLGIAVNVCGLGAIALAAGSNSIAAVAIALLLQGVGVGLFLVAYTDAVTSTLPIEDRGVAGSLTMVTRTIGVVAGATLHSAIHRSYESAAKADGATATAAFVAGFEAAFWWAALASMLALFLSLASAIALSRPAGVRKAGET